MKWGPYNIILNSPFVTKLIFKDAEFCIRHEPSFTRMVYYKITACDALQSWFNFSYGRQLTVEFLAT